MGFIIPRHLNPYKNVYPKLIKFIEDSFYVEDMISGAENATSAFGVYKASKSILEGDFNLRKWSSNSKEFIDHTSDNADIKTKMEVECKSIVEEDQTYTKTAVGIDSREKGDNVLTVLGVKLNCEYDELCFDLCNVIDYAKTPPACHSRRSF